MLDLEEEILFEIIASPRGNAIRGRLADHSEQARNLMDLSPNILDILQGWIVSNDLRY